MERPARADRNNNDAQAGVVSTFLFPLGEHQQSYVDSADVV